MSEHPLAAEYRVWVTDPVNWVWQCRQSTSFPWSFVLATPESRCQPDLWRLVWRPWYDEPGEWEWSMRLKNDSDFRPVWSYYEGNAEPVVWSHKNCEYRFRRKKRALTLPKRTIPMPLREAPEKGTGYWLALPANVDWAIRRSWQGDESEQRWLKRGLLFDTKENAVATAKATLPFGGEE